MELEVNYLFYLVGRQWIKDDYLIYTIEKLWFELFTLRPHDAEGDLTNLRSYIVKTTSLAKAAQELRLGDYLRLSKGEEMGGGRENPQLLANTFEALLGAIFMVEGLEKAKQFVFETLLPLFSEELRSGPPKDAKSSLQELAQTKTKQSPKYKILATVGPDHAKEFKVGVFLQGEQIGSGSGLSKQIAEEAAANDALKQLL
jgi:ribonuclease-3